MKIGNRSRVQKFRGSGMFLAFFHPCLDIYEPSTGRHSSLQTSEQAIERTHIAKKVSW